MSDSYSEIVVAPLLSDRRGERVYTAGFVPLRGVAAPHSLILLTVDGEDVGRTQASKYGAWASDVEIKEIGTHQLVLRNVDEAGKAVSATRAYAITIVGQPEALPVTGNSSTDGILLTVLMSLTLLILLILRDRRLGLIR